MANVKDLVKQLEAALDQVQQALNNPDQIQLAVQAAKTKANELAAAAQGSQAEEPQEPALAQGAGQQAHGSS